MTSQANTNSAENLLPYFIEQLPSLAKRLNLNGSEDKLKCLILEAHKKEKSLRGKLGIAIKSTTESRALAHFLMEHLLPEGPTPIEGEEHFFSAVQHYCSGGRVIFVMNHNAVADSVFLNLEIEKLLAKRPPEDAISFVLTWVAGRRVYNNPLMLTFSLESNMITVIGDRYAEEARTQGYLGEMRRHNASALNWMAENAVPLAVFAEGSWHNDGQLHWGSPDAANVPYVVAKKTGQDPLILACHIDGIHNMVPPSGKPGDDFHRIVEVLTPAPVTLRFRKPRKWSNFVSEVPGKEQDQFQWLSNAMMREVAKIAPPGTRGVFEKELLGF